MLVDAIFAVDIQRDNQLAKVTLCGFRPYSMVPDELALKRRRGESIDLVNGHLFRTLKKKEAVTTEQLTNGWLDWVDYWSVDFDFHGTFRSEWQDFREKKKRSLEMSTPWCQSGQRIAVLIVDIFANTFGEVFDS